VPKVLNIKNEEAYRLASELAARTGETLTEAVLKSLQQRLAKEKSGSVDDQLLADLTAISDRLAAEPDRNPGFSTDDLYDEYGLPH